MSFDLINYLSTFDFSTVSFEDEDLLKTIEDIKPKGSVKSMEEVIVIHEKDYKDAILSADVAIIEGAGFVAADQVPKKVSPLREEFKGEELKNIIADINKSALIYAFVFGNYIPSRSWIKVRGDTYIRLSPLRSVGKHSVLTTVFRLQISQLLYTKNIDNAIISVLARGNIVVAKEKRKFAFPKGHFLDKALSEVIAKDLKVIFQNIGKPAGGRDFSQLVFFNKP